MTETREVISRPRLLANLLKVSGNQFVSLKTRTSVKMKKGKEADGNLNPFYGRVEKVSRIRGRIGFNYTNAVNNAREAEGNPEEFVAGPRPWGKRVEGTPIVEHNGSHYLEVQVEDSMEAPIYFVDGVQATPEQEKELLAFLPAKDSLSIVVRTYKLESIIWLNQGGHEYSVKA